MLELVSDISRFHASLQTFQAVSAWMILCAAPLFMLSCVVCCIPCCCKNGCRCCREHASPLVRASLVSADAAGVGGVELRTIAAPSEVTPPPAPAQVVVSTPPAAKQAQTSLTAPHDAAAKASGAGDGTRRLRVVDVGSLSERLAAVGAEACLSILAHTDELLRVVDPAESLCALVSYKQERAVGEDDFTLDGAALTAVVATANANGVESLWCDAWCFRQSGEVYDHDEFCGTLANVVSCVHLVIWLPLSRAAAVHAAYQYRLWCSFEAACVEVRGLPVRIAGEPTAFQHRLRRLGFWVPGAVCDPHTQLLGRLNAAIYLNLTIFGAIVIYWTVHAVYMYATKKKDGDMTLSLESIQMGVVICIVVPAWYAVKMRRCPALAAQRALAINGQRVLQIMLAATSRKIARGIAPRGIRPEATKSFEPLQYGLPWLPAYDRRDALVVQNVIGRITRGAEAEATRDSAAAPFKATDMAHDAFRGDMAHYMALCAYLAAKATPSAGDPVGQLSVRAWLAQRHISLCVPIGTCWFDGGTVAGSAPATREGWLSARVLEHKWGCRLRAGRTSILLAPTGIFHVPSPVHGRWALSAAEPIPSSEMLHLAFYPLIAYAVFTAFGSFTVERIMDDDSAALMNVGEVLPQDSFVPLVRMLVIGMFSDYLIACLGLAILMQAGVLLTSVRFDVYEMGIKRGLAPYRVAPWSPCALWWLALFILIAVLLPVMFAFSLETYVDRFSSEALRYAHTTAPCLDERQARFSSFWSQHGDTMATISLMFAITFWTEALLISYLFSVEAWIAASVGFRHGASFMSHGTCRCCEGLPPDDLI